MHNDTATPFIFVLMRFSDVFRDIYELGIKGACNDLAARCERMDEQLHDGIILQRIYSQIREADVVVSEMTGSSPNVFYETGYAHAIGQRVILITKDAGDIPFDLQQYPHLIYGNSITDLRHKLKEKLEWALSQPRQAKPQDIDYSQTGLHRTANSFWLGHDLMWLIEVAADPRTPAEHIWYGVRLCMEHAQLLSLDRNTMVYTRLEAQEQLLRAVKDQADGELTTLQREQVISAARDAMAGFGSDLTRHQGTYLRPIDPELHSVWLRLKATGEGDVRYHKPGRDE